MRCPGKNTNRPRPGMPGVFWNSGVKAALSHGLPICAFGVRREYEANGA